MNNNYINTYLQEVIVRADFAVPLLDMQNDINPKLKKSIMNLFPICEFNDLIANEFRVSGDKFESNQTTVKEYKFFSKDRKKFAIINEKCLLIRYEKYEKFEILLSNFMSIIDVLFDVNADVQINRLGLRYVNNIHFDNEPNPTDWEEYLDIKLLSIFNVRNNKQYVVRAFQNLEFHFEDIHLQFQYGMRNPDYPMPIYKKIFILDYDAHCIGMIQKSSELKEYLIKFHGEINKLFESSITEKLRSVMGIE